VNGQSISIGPIGRSLVISGVVLAFLAHFIWTWTQTAENSSFRN